MRRIAGLAALACALTACLLSIDESRIDAAGADDDDDLGDTGSNVRKDAGNPYTDPPTKDAEPPVTTDDGAVACSTPGLTLCGDTCFDLTGTKEHCGTCDKQCGAAELCKGSKCGPPGSCKELLSLAPSTPTGATSLTVGGTVVPAHCDMNSEGGGFTLVYRVSGGVAGDPYSLWTGGGVNDDKPAEATPVATANHYVSRILGGWNQGFTVTDVRVRLLNGSGQVLKELKFDGSLSSRESWFSKARLQSSPWTDLAAQAATNVFTPGGHDAERRRWFITKPYPQTGCPDDEGWLLVHGTYVSPICDYEKPMPTIKIMYAPGTTAQKWSAGVTAAQSFAVYVR